MRCAEGLTLIERQGHIEAHLKVERACENLGLHDAPKVGARRCERFAI
jgi:hypothetical protein